MAGRCASLSRSSISGRAPNGSSASSSRRSTSRASGNCAATTITAIPGASSVTTRRCEMASAHDFTFSGIDHRPIDLKQYAGKPLLVVNVASFCGFTPQYRELQKLHETYGPKVLVVLGVPSHDFGAQEPKSE